MNTPSHPNPTTSHLFLPGPLQEGFDHGVYPLVSCWTIQAIFRVACSESTIVFTNTEIHMRVQITIFACLFLQWRIFRLLLMCPPCSRNAFMYSCREKMKRQILCNSMVSDRPGLNNATVCTLASYLTSLNFNFPQNGHKAASIRLRRGLSRRPPGK